MESDPVDVKVELEPPDWLTTPVVVTIPKKKLVL